MKFIMPVAMLPVMLAIGCGRLNEKSSSAEAQTRMASEQAAATDTTAFISAGNTDEEAFRTVDTAEKQVPITVAKTVPTANPDWDRKIVKTADLSIEVPKFGMYTTHLHQLVRAAGGYIAQEEQNESSYKIENTISIKVPVALFDDFVLGLSADSAKLISKKIVAQDVTMQLVDTKSRLETKKEVRQRYLELLRGAHSMKDILVVQNEINSLQEEMDGAAGRIAYLSHASAYSTINLNYFQVLNPGAQIDKEPSFLQKLGNAFKEGGSWLGSAIVGMVGLWPLLLALLVVLAWWKRRPKNYVKNNVSAS